MKLKDIDVVLTGASGGIGSALCQELVAAGARVLAVGRREMPLHALAAAFGPGKVTPFAADLVDPAQRARLATEVATLSRPALLVHAAGSGGFALFGSENDDPAALFASNVVAPMALTALLLPLLRRQPEAAVVAIGSTFGSLAFPGFAAYSASKFALRGWIEAMAREAADGPVRFQWVAPRATDTAFNPPAVQALNRALGSHVDKPEAVARAIRRAIEGDRLRCQIGWPERLLVRLNGAFPGLVDRGLRRSLTAVRAAAESPAVSGALGQATASPGLTP